MKSLKENDIYRRNVSSAHHGLDFLLKISCLSAAKAQVQHSASMPLSIGAKQSGFEQMVKSISIERCGTETENSTVEKLLF